MVVHLTAAQEQKLQELAVQSGLTPSEITEAAVLIYLRHMEALASDVREGEESAEREGWVTHEQVFDRLRKRLQKTA